MVHCNSNEIKVLREGNESLSCSLATGCGKSRSFYCINYRCKESELLGLPLCVLCFSIFSVVLSIEHFQFALIHFLRLDSGHVIVNVFNSLISACESSLSGESAEPQRSERAREEERNFSSLARSFRCGSALSPLREHSHGC